MTKNKWVPLTEYSNKYQVSISTLRRRIRSHRVEFIYEDGKYLLKDSPLNDHQPNKQRVGRSDSAPPQPPNFEMPNSSSLVYDTRELLQPPSSQPVSPPPQNVKPVETQPQGSKDCSTSLTYLNEIKKAYALILQEKEEQVLILKDEVADLQTLVKVLESENQRLRLEMGKLKTPTPPEKSPAIVAAESLYDSDWGAELELE